jgi:hypothetical protein
MTANTGALSIGCNVEKMCPIAGGEDYQKIETANLVDGCKFVLEFTPPQKLFRPEANTFQASACFYL